MKVAIYVRVSTDEQAVKGNSLSEQKERLYAYCKAMGWDEADLYEDDGYSAKDMNRPKLQEFLGKVSEYDMIVTTKIDRLCRNLLDLLTVVDTLAANKCGYASSTESFDTSTPAGRMVLQILGAFAEFERERIRERVRDNLRSLSKKKDKAIVRPCYGYDVVDGFYKINEVEAENVRKMAEWAMQGEGAYKIAKRMNDLGATTKDGNKFYEGAVRKLLQRETISGAFVYNRRYNHKNKELIRPQEEWIITEDHHEPIIDKDTFKRLQEVMKSRGFARKQADNERWLLSGLVICEHCGSKMVGMHRKKGTKNYFRYVCAGYHKKGECFYHYIDRDDLEQIVINDVQEGKIHPQGEARAVEDNENMKEDNSQQIEILQDKLKKLNNKLQKQLALYEEDELSLEDYKIARKRIDKERDEINKKIEDLFKETDLYLQEEFNKKVDAYKDDLTSGNRLLQKNAIRNIINEIRITKGEIIKIITAKIPKKRVH